MVRTVSGWKGGGSGGKSDNNIIIESVYQGTREQQKVQQEAIRAGLDIHLDALLSADERTMHQLDHLMDGLKERRAPGTNCYCYRIRGFKSTHTSHCRQFVYPLNTKVNSQKHHSALLEV